MYSTNEPWLDFSYWITFCLNMHDEALQRTVFSTKHKDKENAEAREEGRGKIKSNNWLSISQGKDDGGF